MKKLTSIAHSLHKGSSAARVITRPVPKAAQTATKFSGPTKQYLSNGFSLNRSGRTGSSVTTSHFKRSLSIVRPAPTTMRSAAPSRLTPVSSHTRRALPFSPKVRSFCSQSKFEAVVPLPNNNFSVFSMSRDQPIQNFLDNMKTEDPSILDVSILNSNGQQLSSTNTLSTVSDNFQVRVNSKNFQLTTTFGVDNDGKFSARKWQIQAASSGLPHSSEREARILQLKKELYPLWEKKQEIDQKAATRANILAVGVLAYLTAQFTTLAYLTWWTFNWDIMEPVTYFITFSTGMLGYIYFLLAKRDYTYPDAYDATITSTLRKLYHNTEGFDAQRYFALEHELKKIEPLAVLEIPDEVESMKQVQKED